MNLRLSMLGLFALAACAIGCSHPAEVKESELSMHPESGKTVLVIMRPGHKLGAARAPRISLYRVTEGGQEFIGILAKKGQRLAYTSPPGDQLFMIVGGENTDFMEAHLDAGKTYYAFALTRMGVLKPRFSLLPVRPDPAAEFSMKSDEFAGCQQACKWVEPSEKGQDWYDDNKASVDRKRVEALNRWNSRGEEYKERQILNKEDGVP